MSKPGRRLCGVLPMLVALGLVACDSSDGSNSSVYNDVNLSTLEPVENVAPPPVVVPEPPRRYALDEAARRGLVSYEVSGRNASSGAALTLKIRRLAAEPIEVYVPPGTVFRTGSPGVQAMVARSIVKEIAEEVAQEFAQQALEESGIVQLIDDAVHNFLVEAYCRDFELENPSPADGFVVSSFDSRSAALLDAAHDRGLHHRAIQAAIWMDLGVAPERIAEEFPASPADFEAARSLLASLAPAPAPSEGGNAT